MLYTPVKILLFHYMSALDMHVYIYAWMLTHIWNLAGMKIGHNASSMSVLSVCVNICVERNVFASTYL
jgi:hypothetical protein